MDVEVAPEQEVMSGTQTEEGAADVDHAARPAGGSPASAAPKGPSAGEGTVALVSMRQ